MSADDAEQFTEWLNNPELTTNLQSYPSAITVDGERAFLDTASDEHNYSIIDIETDKVIGNCGLMSIDTLNQTAEVGMFIGNQDYWNKGYGTEALTLLLDYGFKALNLHNVMLRVYAFNKRAIKAYEKTGFRHIGTRREALHRNLKKHDILFMDLLVNEFYEKYPALR
jgi:RimJ/RimL family protein N-acetyltransferase